jgi:hypothetical protein
MGLKLINEGENMWAQSGVLLVSLFLGMCLTPLDCRAEDRVQTDPLSKITFELDRLNQDGLGGPPEGLRALHYEFCIPGDAVHEAMVREIDPTIQIFPKSRGRIGCSGGEYLCVGSTHQPDFRTVLLKLASLPYVKRIDQTFFE